MNYELVYDFYNSIDVKKLKKMNKADRTEYFKTIEKEIKKRNSKQESMMKKTFDYQLKEVKELEKMKESFNLDEFKQILYKKPSDIDVSKETILFYSLFENTVRIGFNFVFSAKNYLSILTDILYFYRDNFNFQSDYVNKEDDVEITLDVHNELLQKYFNTLIETYLEYVNIHIMVGSFAIRIVSEIVDEYILEFVGLRDEFYMNIEMITVCHKELETISKVMTDLDSDGFSIAKMVSDIETLRYKGLESSYRTDVFYDMDEFKLIADNYNEKIEVNSG